MSGSVLTDVVEGWTGALPFTLNADGDPVDLTGRTVSVILKDARNLTVYDSTTPVAVTGTTAGLVTFTPSSSDLVAARGPYRIRFRVATTSEKVFFPNSEEDLIRVNPL